MMKLNIYKEGFPPSNGWHITEAITAKVFDILSTVTGISDTRSVIIINNPSGPLCCNPTSENLRAFDSSLPAPLPEVSRILILDTKGNYYCQWVYQLAHEICHHLINGKMCDGLCGCQWFEETLCEEASLFCLSKLSDPILRRQWDCPHYALCVRSYLDSHLQSSYSLRQKYYSWNPIEHPQGIAPWRDTLEETSTLGIGKLQRTICTAVASLLYPIFLHNPRLWEIAAHIGDSTQFPKLEALLSHLEVTATPAYSESLKEMNQLLLG
ncbi:MAG: hypothetical protein K2J24_02875 [Muribaculaceae bacterium]|nr:hypothetical protein [Muribaculaceae bacterium]